MTLNVATTGIRSAACAGASQQQDGERDATRRNHQAPHPIVGARRRKALAATSESAEQHARRQHDRRTGRQIGVIGDQQARNRRGQPEARSPAPSTPPRPSPQQRAAAAGSSIGPTASSVPNAWKLATSASTTSATNTAPYGTRAPTARRNAGSNAPTANGRYSAATTSRITLLDDGDLQQRRADRSPARCRTARA